MVHSIGINEPTNIKFKIDDKHKYHKIDLSLTNSKLIEQLKSISKKPDVILASPPCESWSGADCDGKMFVSIDNKCNWKIKNRNFYNSYNNKANPVKRRDFVQKETSRIIGESTIGATIKIIEFFEPKVWVIENPQTSKIWDFQRNHWDFQWNEHITYYSCYNKNFSLKPTIFKSNKQLSLKNNRVKGNKNHMSRGSYSKRSAIPKELIKDLVEQILIYIKE